MKLLLATLLASLTLCHCAVEEGCSEESLKKINKKLAEHDNNITEAFWANIFNKSDKIKRTYADVSADFRNDLKDVDKDIKTSNWRSCSNATLSRQFKKLATKVYKELPTDNYAELLEVLPSMVSNFSKVLVCDYNDRDNCDLSLESEIDEVMSTSRDSKELEHYWTQLYNKAGSLARSSFERYIELSTIEAKLNNFSTGAEFWLDEYEVENFEGQIEGAIKAIEPLYKQLHGYVRHHLRIKYGDEVVSENGPLPMHLLGNIFSHDWSYIEDIVSLFSDQPSGGETVSQTLREMYNKTDNSFALMGLKKLPQIFWDKSIFGYTDDGHNCITNIWNFCLDYDVRYTECESGFQHFPKGVHYIVGRIQYFLQSRTQPFIYSINSVFEKAVGEVFAMSASTPKYMERVGFLKNYIHDETDRINELLLTALEKIVFLRYVFTMEKYRWTLLAGEVDKSKWNSKLWGLRKKYLGIKPPANRTKNDFDAIAPNYDTADLVSLIIRFQLYRSACIKAGQYVANNDTLPLDNCDIYKSKEVGKDFGNMMSLGDSKPWPDVLQAFTGQRTLDGTAIADYFQPLHKWLKKYNRANNVCIGWNKSTKCGSK